MTLFQSWFSGRWRRLASDILREHEQEMPTPVTIIQVYCESLV